MIVVQVLFNNVTRLNNASSSTLNLRLSEVPSSTITLLTAQLAKTGELTVFHDDKTYSTSLYKI